MEKPQPLLTLLLLLSCMLNAQIGNYWQKSDASKGKVATDKFVASPNYPQEYKLFSLDIESLRHELLSIVGATAKKQSTIISLPNAAGQIEDFEVFEASNFEPDLQARFPQIRAYSGKGITDKHTTLKLALGTTGISTTVFRVDENPTEFIEAYSQDHTIYSVYKSQRDKSSIKWACGTVDKPIVESLNKAVENTKKANNGMLKVLRLAQSCTGEYAAFYGASVAGTAADQLLVMNAFNATLARCNGVYEKDLAVHLNLIAGTVNVIYYNAATDPYANGGNGGKDGLGASGRWNGQLMNTLHNVLGDAAFDIGHLFGQSGGGGNAGCIGCICSNDMNAPLYDPIAAGDPCVDCTPYPSPDNYKGSGFTSPANGVPQGDFFDIDYVVHEVGHQLGANHTFTFVNHGNGYEVGSGITIMGYAGITGVDLAPHSIDAYHAGSIQEIQANLNLPDKGCIANTNIAANNATPVVALTGLSITIPISTPFALDCTGADANPGDALTYSWEQYNRPLVYSNAFSNATANKASGPNFISWAPSASSLRYFPKMTSVIANSLSTAQVGGDAGMNSEFLLSIAKAMTFRVTVRDNSPYVNAANISVGQTILLI